MNADEWKQLVEFLQSNFTVERMHGNQSVHRVYLGDFTYIFVLHTKKMHTWFSLKEDICISWYPMRNQIRIDAVGLLIAIDDPKLHIEDGAVKLYADDDMYVKFR